ncbi:MAG: helix-turn-helix domain-containing protein [Alphaproteobacteria bacterium]|jgi:transcriptional regulator with XRE-family HTH domain|nr:helix-turn-helix domain-containing protein [Alphaproteobacteria bacterium]
MTKKSISLKPGERVHSIRKKLGLSRAEFEQLTGISASTLRYFENGERELLPSKARVLSTILIYRFCLKEEEASESFLLHGVDSHNFV